VKFAAQAALSTIGLFVLVMLLVLYVQRRALLSNVEASGFEMAKIFAFSSVPAVATGDYLMLQHVVDGIASEPRALYAMILLPNGEVFVHSTARERGQIYRDALSQRAATADRAIVQHYVRNDGIPVYDFAIPVYVLTEKRAIARVGLSIEREMAGITRTGLSIVFLGLAALAFSLVWAAYQSRKLTRPVDALVKGTREIVRGNLDHRLPVSSTDEIGQLAEAFNQMVAELAAARHDLITKTRMAAIGEISARVAHETRNPLGALTNCLHLLRRGKSIAPDDAELIQIMEAEVQRLNTMVSDFLAFGRPRPPQVDRVDLREVLTRVLGLLEQDLGVAQGIHIESSVDPAATIVWADAAQLHQVLWNLLLNAAQAMGETGKIRVTTTRRGDMIEMAIADDGPGIAPDALSKIFEPFFTTRSMGSGLGLAIVKRIVDDHGGTIRVDSKLGAGTTVFVSLCGER
jgi:signal transduction histidine kinase